MKGLVIAEEKSDEIGARLRHSFRTTLRCLAELDTNGIRWMLSSPIDKGFIYLKRVNSSHLPNTGA